MTWNSWMILTMPQQSSIAVGYRATLEMVRSALRREDWVEAEALLMRAGAIAGNDPAFFNLVGVLREVEGNKEAAAEFYGKAIRSNSEYEPAQQNMRRLYELRCFGHTDQSVALGDEVVK
jgi:Flp pilus assembly protein TadD